MATDNQTARVEALLMALLAYAHDQATIDDEDIDRAADIAKLLSKGGVLGSEIAGIFGVSEATVSNRLSS